MGDAMPKRVTYEGTILAALLLGSCGDMPRAFTEADSRRLDLAEMNLRNAARASSEMVDRVERGERRIEDLEERIGSLERTLSEAAEAQNRNNRLLEERWQAYQRHTH